VLEELLEETDEIEDCLRITDGGEEVVLRTGEARDVGGGDMMWS